MTVGRGITRRQFARSLLCAGAALAFQAPWRSLAPILFSGSDEADTHLAAAWAQPMLVGAIKPGFWFAQLKYRGGNWDPYPSAAAELMREVVKRTSVEASLVRRELQVLDPKLFHYPFIWIAGRDAFEPFNDEEVDVLRRFLRYGGFLCADDAGGYTGFGFDEAFRFLMERVFPDRPLVRLPSDHALFRSYYLLPSVGGRRLVSPFLEGIVLGDFTPVIYCRNDLGGAWFRDPMGNWSYPCVPGGEAQRLEAFKLGINLVMYALATDYKKDQIHEPFIRKRIGWRSQQGAHDVG